ncbi:hypothetical protein [Siccibacter turicensis]|uniref:hypothetical protein n=1 Tax=Siccibacter turicensis TaxID=357233 RepID=UPI002A6B6F1F|nr:hypothetical protein [Siccibacter turicensis]
MTVKLAFAFPSQPKPGNVMGKTPPEMEFSYSTLPTEGDLIVTVGIIGMKDEALYSLHLNVFSEDDVDVTLAPSQNKDISSYHQLNGKNGEVVSYISLTDKFKVLNTGTYRLFLKLLEGHVEDEQTNWSEVDRITSYLCVSEEWGE